MKTILVISSKDLETPDLKALLQAIRDCEVANFPEKDIHIKIDVPELTTDSVKELLTSIKPPFKFGPLLFKFREEAEQRRGKHTPRRAG